MMYYRLIIESVKAESNSFPEIQMKLYSNEDAFTIDFKGFKAYEVSLAAFQYLMQIASKDLMTFRWSEGRDANDPSLDKPIGPVSVVTREMLVRL